MPMHMFQVLTHRSCSHLRSDTSQYAGDCSECCFGMRSKIHSSLREQVLNCNRLRLLRTVKSGDCRAVIDSPIVLHKESTKGACVEKLGERERGDMTGQERRVEQSTGESKRR